MALKRLDEEFELKPGTQLLPYMKRLLPSLEGRFQDSEEERKTFDMAVEDMRAVALQRTAARMSFSGNNNSSENFKVSRSAIVLLSYSVDLSAMLS